MKKGLMVLAAALMMTLGSASAQAAHRGFVVAGPSYWGPYWGPAWGGYWAHPDAGKIKLDTKVKDAGVFINGAYAGTTHQNKSMYLRQGSYTIEIKEAGQTRYAEKIYVVAGKTLRLEPGL
jgi:hypothetical protein